MELKYSYLENVNDMHDLVGNNSHRINKTSNFTSHGTNPEKILNEIRSKLEKADQESRHDVKVASKPNGEAIKYMQSETYFVGLNRNNKFAKYLMDNGHGTIHKTMDDILIIGHKDIRDNRINILYLQNVAGTITNVLSEYGIETFMFMKWHKYV